MRSSSFWLGIVKDCIIAVPIVYVGTKTTINVIKDIKGRDYQILLDKDRFNKQSAKYFSQETFWSKVKIVTKSALKNLLIETVKALPLILKCFFGYAIVTGFEDYMNGDVLSAAEQASIDRYGKTRRRHSQLLHGGRGFSSY